MSEPPVCKRCCDSPCSIEKLQQHSDVLKRPKEQPKPPRCILEGSLGHISLERPFSRDANFVTDNPLKTMSASRPLPAWMCLLPSQKNPNVHPPKHSVLHHRSTFPYFESTRMTTPNESQAHTPPDKRSVSTIAAHSCPTVTSSASSAQLRADISLSGSSTRPEIPSSNQSFMSFVESPEVTADHHMSYVPEQPLCPSAYAVQPSINFSRPRQLSAAKSAPSVINEPEKAAGAQRARRRLTKRVPPQKAAEVLPKQPEKERRKSRPWKLDWSRETSPEESLHECTKTDHTPEPSQDVSPAKSPFLKELSGFFTSRAGK
jgi:hypothetical protein